MPSLPLRLQLAKGKSKIISSIHWLHTADKLQGLGQVEQEITQSVPEADIEFSATMNELRRLRREIKAHESNTGELLPNLTISFPSKVSCDKMYMGYLRSFQPIYHILHVPTFEQNYTTHWQQPELTSHDFRIKLGLILAIGATFVSQESAIEQHELQRLTRGWIYAAQWWLSGPSEGSATNTEGIQVACLLQLARQTTSIGIGSWHSGDIALRMAMTVGLHRDPSHFPQLSPFQRQTRRSLWFAALELSLQFSIATNLLLAPIVKYDTQLPANINDEDIAAATKETPEPQADNITSDHSLQRLLARSLPTRLQAASLLCTREGTYHHEEAINLGNDVLAVCREVAKFALEEISESTSNSGSHEFQAGFLDIQLRRYVLLLHRPFVLQARRDPKFYFSRKICLETAMVIASYSKKLNLPSKVLDDISSLMKTVRSPINGPLNLDVITMLGLEVMTQIEESGPSPATDAAVMLAKATRAPILDQLEHIQEQLLQIIASGGRSLKRYAYITAMLHQLQAMEEGRSVIEAVAIAKRDVTSRVKPLLEGTLASLTNAGSSLDPQAGGLLPSSTGEDDGDLIMGEFDIDSILGIPSWSMPFYQDYAHIDGTQDW